MGTFLICCLWGQGWIAASRLGAIGWLWSLALRARRRTTKAVTVPFC